MSADCESCVPVCGSYGSIDDLRSCGLPASALADVPLKDQQSALLRASRMADTYLRDRYHLPLACPYDPALVFWVCQVASYMLMSTRGYNPNMGADVVIRLAYDDAIKALMRVANGQQQLCVTQANPSSLQPEFGTNPSRGFGGDGGTDVPFVGPNSWGQ